MLSSIAPARADINLSPLRHVISAKEPSAVFTVSNPSSRILDGRISWIDLAAAEDGYEPASADLRSNLSAAPFLVVSPADFRLEPGARIEVTVRLKEGATPPRGERRSHLLIETAAARTSIRKASQNGLQIDIGLGVSAPVILRGAGKASAVIGDTKLLRDEAGLLVLSTAIEQQGGHSAYGRLVVRHKPSGKGKVLDLGVRENVAAYTDGPPRRFETPLGKIHLPEGELEVRYEGRAEYEGRVFDSRLFDIEKSE